MTKQELHRSISESTGNESNICQIYAMKNGKTLYQDQWHGFSTGDAVNVMSVTKGIMALLTGIASDMGYIGSTSQTVISFFPDYTVKRGEKTIRDVTIEHLLTMTAPYKYRSEPWTKVCTSDNWTIAALDLLGGRNGITGDFKYATLGIQILAGILENASGMSCIELANKYLFSPLGIPEHRIHGASSKEDQFEYIMNKQTRPNEWYSAPEGTVTAGWGLTLSARDMARIGQMILNGGRYDDKQIVSKTWIDRMTSPYMQLGRNFGNMYYGYLWYIPYKDKPVFIAAGDSGNMIYTNAEKNISVGVTGTFKPRIFDRLSFIENIVIPAAESI